MTYAIIGYGKMGKLYDSLIQAKYIVEPFPIKEKIQFNNVEELIFYKQPVDLVIITSPTPSHYSIAEKLLRGGYNVLCEKPICLSFEEAQKLEKIAEKNKLILYQSTLERYNPIVKFIKTNISVKDIEKIESFRYGESPTWSYTSDPKYDLGIHDVDLWFYLFDKKIEWKINVGYGKQQREVIIYLKNEEIITLDLLNKRIIFNNSFLDFGKANNNPILEMLLDLSFKGIKMNEKWSKEIQYIENTIITNSIILEKTVANDH